MNKVVKIKIPKAKIQGAQVDTSSIRYFDEKFSVINLNEKEDANKAIKLAEEDAKKEAEKTGILELADKQAEVLIEGILIKALPAGYKLEFTKEEK